MWRTPEGTRVLRDLERQVARRGLETAIDLIELGIDADDPWEFGVPQFDALTLEQQLALLADVGRALFYTSVLTPTQFMKSYLGIDDEYFASISPDPRNLVQVRRTLRQLIRERPR